MYDVFFPQFAGLSDVSISDDIPVEGDISVPLASHSADDEFSTLDEPVKDTIVRLPHTLIVSMRKLIYLLSDCYFISALQFYITGRHHTIE